MAMTIEQRAVNFTASVLRTAEDWQDGQDALSNHSEFGPWLEESGDPAGEAQRIIRAAEVKLAAELANERAADAHYAGDRDFTAPYEP